MKHHMNLNSNSIRKWTTRVIVAIMLVLLIVPTVPIPARAAEDVVGETANALAETEGTGAVFENSYILETSTGQQGGDKIAFFLIRYRTNGDSKKTVRKQYIMPNQDSLGLGRMTVSNYGSDLALASTVSSKMGYTTVDSWKEEIGLKPYKTDQFFFTTSVPMDTVISVDAYMMDSGTWTCLAVRLFRVDEIYGLRMAGTWSAEWFIDFKGQLILEMIDNGKISWSKKSAAMLYMDTLAEWRTKFDTDATKAYATHVTQKTKTYGFRVDFADVYKAGFEALYATYDDGQKKAIDLSLAEVMTINVVYDDIYGVPRMIHLPASTSAALWLDQRNMNQNILGLGLQGGQLAFTGEIPDFKSLRNISVTVGSSKAKQEAGITSIGSNSRRDARERISDNPSSGYQDDAYILSFAMYNMASAVFAAGTDGALLKYTFTGRPEYFMKSLTSDGFELTAGLVTSLNMKPYDGTDLDDNLVWRNCYLVKMTTDNVTSASTYGDLKVRFNYVMKSGLPSQTEDMDLRNLVNNYYGYWPGAVTSHFGPYQEDFAYRYGISRGQTLCFFISANNLSHFTGCNLTLGSNGDEYQVGDIKFYSVRCLGRVHADWKDLAAEGNKSHVLLYRDFEGKELSESDTALLEYHNDEPTLVLPGTTKRWDFVTNTIETIEEDAFDVTDYAIDYATAMQNFGFTKERMRYTVTVHVADDKKYIENGSTLTNANAYQDTDSGSENLFYFQLVFERGVSGFVLSNQQLEGDRFQSGTQPDFEILTNQDYGEILEVRIIPDDISEDNKKYDKLNISYISVTEGTVQGTHREWQCRDVGWVGIDYRDEASDRSIVGKEGRTLGSVARSYNVDYVTNCVDIEFSLVTNRGDKTEDRNPDTGKMTRNYVDQLKGTVTGKIYYTDNTGTAQEREFDVVKAMYNYMNRSSSGDHPASDPNYMFRESHTDRFVVSMSDVSVIKAIDFYVKASDYNYKWNIGGITARIVKEKGNLRLNKFDEYEYEYPTSDDPESEIILKAASEASPIASPILSSTLATVHIPVTCSPIKIEVEQGQTSVSYTRMPLTGDDKVNIYVFPTQDRLVNRIQEYDLDCEITYVHPAGMFYNKTNTENPMIKFEGDDENRPMFYVLGLSARNMIDLNHLWVKAKALKANNVQIDFAIVQQVRSNTVVATYYIDFDNAEVTTDGVSGFPSGKKDYLGYSEEQVVTLQLGEGTATSGLYPERQDVGIAISYKSSFDPYGPTYLSPIRYLTDEDVNRIKDGQVSVVHFSQDFVGEIVDVRAVVNGGVQATIDKAVVATYQKDTGGYRELTGWYSFGNSQVLDDSLRGLTRTAMELEAENCVMPVTFTFKTSAASGSHESGTRDPVKATIYVTDWTERVLAPITIPDLRKYIDGTDTNFMTGKTQTVKILLTGAAGVRRIELEPSNGNGTAGWSIDTVSCKVADNDPVEKAFNDRIYENNPRSINFSNITMNVQVQYYNVTKGAFDSVSATNEEISVVSPVDQPIYFTPQVAGSEYGYEIKINEVTASDAIADDVSDYCKQSGGRDRFDPPKNETGKTKYYRVVITSKEDATAKVTVKISIDPTLKDNKALEDMAELAVREKFDEKKQELIEHLAVDYKNFNQQPVDDMVTEASAKIQKMRYDSNKKLEEQLSAMEKIVDDLDEALKKAYEDAVTEKKNVVEKAFAEEEQRIKEEVSAEHTTCLAVRNMYLEDGKAALDNYKVDMTKTLSDNTTAIQEIQEKYLSKSQNAEQYIDTAFKGDFAAYQNQRIAEERNKVLANIELFEKEADLQIADIQAMVANAKAEITNKQVSILEYDLSYTMDESVDKQVNRNKTAADNNIDSFRQSLNDIVAKLSADIIKYQQEHPQPGA
ncbi:MAG: hypothetical protein IKP92_02950 [Lachnospiraceae bacterium]|nr:hypothetical protein [Lachnospiraceae bacterium]